ncbi:thiamine pyrophosphate-requiring protein [Nocardiopsis terrae]|uniref:Pyruvate dehydrogenase (Quinone) n=1 Tax=Nocardiopsis terrae TaxID=372655 RepID=A0ABR9HG97_9ACTN|nr:thiamine pyrophosphate-requiring protein [Nocardiopsis terrae]MBE1458043.1 pyruvate dehydrogenase (quinone) [Nocardiopsis terrae]GHC82525.1 thiamine pyrophosphate-requiring protein [Nocardiopsis terrae]
MVQNVADHLLRRLSQWGVTEIFGYPGDSVNGLVAQMAEVDDGPRFVQSRHEEMSAFEAVGYAKFGGGLGVCMATGGPGAVHLLNGLYDAKLDHVPVLALVGQASRSAMGGAYQQEIDLHSLFKDVSSAFLETVNVPEQLPNVLDRAVRTALSERAPTTVIIPADVQELDYSPPQHAFKHVPSSAPDRVVGGGTVLPPESELDRAAEVIDAGERVAVLVGQGARGAAEEVLELADATGAGIAKALLGKDVLPDALPQVTGSIGLLGTKPSWELMRDCDTLLIVGSNLPYSQFLPPFGRRAVEIDIDPRYIGMRYPTEVNLVGDAASTLHALSERLNPSAERSKGRREWRATVEANVRRWWSVLDAQAEVGADPVNPMLVIRELSPRLPDDAVVTADSGSVTNWYARFLRLGEGNRASLSGTLATMGCAVPYAVGAKFAVPDRPAVALVGDGAMQMNGLMEMLTARRYQDLWQDPRLVVCVLHNNDLNQVTWELRAMTGSPKTPYSQDLPDMSYAGFAEAIGLTGIRVDRPQDVGPAWDRALAAQGPVVLDVRCDGDVPPIPPQAEREQVTDTLRALLSDDPDRVGVAARGLATKIQEFLPHRR